MEQLVNNSNELLFWQVLQRPIHVLRDLLPDRRCHG